MPYVLRNPFADRLFKRSDTPVPKRSVVDKNIRNMERGGTIMEPDLEYMLPDSGDMDGIFWVWNLHTRISISWPQLEPLSRTRR